MDKGQNDISDGRILPPTVKPPRPRDMNPDPTKPPWYTEPPRQKSQNDSTPQSEPPKPIEKKKDPWTPPPKPKKREFVNMTLSKLVRDSDQWIENNDKYGYRNHKIASSRLLFNQTYGSMYYVRMNVGSPPQI